MRPARSLVLTLAGLAVVVLGLPGPAVRAQQPGAPARPSPGVAGGRFAGFERHQAMAKASPFASATWRFLGPKNLSGRCTDVAVVSAGGKGRTIYVATASGGAWKKGYCLKPKSLPVTLEGNRRRRVLYCCTSSL